jgi:FlaG/FlaF family flagellin (archaellin)
MLNKKGLSGVVTTVLIVLIGLAAVGIIAGFLLPAVQESSSQISSSCFQIALTPSGCSIDPVSGEVTVNVKRGPGSSSLEELRFVLTSAAGESEVSTQATTDDDLAELQTKAFTVTPTTVTPESVGVAPVVTNEAGEGKLCPESVKVSCA